MRVTIRAGAVHIDGYVNAVGRLSRRLIDDDGQPYKEMIEPGAFLRALKMESTIPALLNHDWGHVLADTSGGLALKEDTIGLHAELESTDQELAELASGGKLRGWSFGFYPLDTREELTTDGERHVIITDLDLKEVSVIDDRMVPAYAGTSINSRAEPDQARQLVYRAMDNDIICRVVEPPDYRRYDDAIERLKKATYKP